MSQDHSIIWKPVAGYESRFLVSSRGEIKSLKSRTGSGKLRKLAISNKGYWTLGIKQNGKMKVVLVHRLLAQTFIKNPENKPCVNHIDSNRLNNNLENLEWCTQSENMLHAVKFGNMQIRGELNYRAKLREKDVFIIKKRLLANEKIVEIARDYGVSATAISLIKRKVNWKYLERE